MAKFEKGVSGNLKGRPKNKTNSAFLIEKIAEKLEANNNQALGEIIDGLIEQAKNGDIAAITLLFARYAGAPPKAQEDNDKEFDVRITYSDTPKGDKEGIDEEMI